MRSYESKVSLKSDYYVYAPSTIAKKLYLYPVSIGHFFYEPNYFIHRNSFDSFLIMYIKNGDCTIKTKNFHQTAHTGDFVLLDCYTPHGYGNSDTWEAIWLHFDGKLARNYYQEITSRYGSVLSLDTPENFSCIMEKIYNAFRNSEPIIETVFSSYITQLLDNFLFVSFEHQKTFTYTTTISNSISFINENFHQPISLEEIAAKANLSLYHFTRIFAKETGFTPHQYLINTRISAAKFMLKTSETSIKDIAFSTGFNSESSFCSTFKKWENITPSEYRKNR